MLVGEEDSDNNDDNDDHEGDIVPESSESFLQQEVRPRKKARKSIVTNTSTLALGKKQAEPQIKKIGAQVQVKSTPIAKQQGKEKQAQKQRQKGWSTNIYSRHGYGKENHAPGQRGDGAGDPEVDESGATVEDNAGGGGHGDGNGSDEETEYAFGESVEFSSTPKAGVVVGGAGASGAASGGGDGDGKGVHGDITMAE